MSNISNENRYERHLIECQCILKIFEKKTKPLYHKFAVFSLLDENGELEQKYVSCNNCGSIHRVYDVCKSEIMWGKDGYEGLVNKVDDIVFNLENNGNEKIVEILVTNKIEDMSIWEYVEFLLENELEGHVVLNKNNIKDTTIMKVLYINKKGFKIKTENVQRFV